jgi:hypothetical protein
VAPSSCPVITMPRFSAARAIRTSAWADLFEEESIPWVQVPRLSQKLIALSSV